MARFWLLYSHLDRMYESHWNSEYMPHGMSQTRKGMVGFQKELLMPYLCRVLEGTELDTRLKYGYTDEAADLG